jgi:hypothetical protein
VIHLGGEAAVVVPVSDFMRLCALEQAASQQELEDARRGPRDARRGRPARRGARPAGSLPYWSPDRRWLRIGRYRVMHDITAETVSHLGRGLAGN